jgi:tetratricopeptide (TPR) repeat protein
MGLDLAQTDELLSAVVDFEYVIKSTEKECYGDVDWSQALCMLFAMRSAYSICMRLRQMDCVIPDPAKNGSETECRLVEQTSLPTLNTVRCAKQMLLDALEAGDGGATVMALEKMEVFALCPAPDEQLARMERIAGSVTGPVRVVFWIELALFAVERDDFNTAREYVTQAWGLEPSSWELYNLCVLEGLFALNAGNTREAVQFLERSINACQIDAHTSLHCAVRAPNFLLAQKLFEQGERIAVLNHLLECKNVWQWPTMPMNKWIGLIERGEIPDFHESNTVRTLNLPSSKIYMQWRRANFLDELKGLTLPRSKPQSPEEVVVARKVLKEKCERHISANVKEKIAYLDKELTALPDQPSSHPADPPEPSEPAA